MANEIRLKRGSGSNPSASDLVVGEVALRTDNGKLFTKKDDNSIAEIGTGVTDGDKGDITVSNSGATFTIDNGVIDNANINASAAIAGSKISPTFTSNVEISNTYPSLTFTDTNHNSDYRITNNDGQLIIYDITNSAHRLNVNADGHVDILGRLDVPGIAVTNNISVGGTVDGRDLASDGSKLDGIEANATADQTASDIKTLFNSSGLVNAQIDASAAIARTKLANVDVVDDTSPQLGGNLQSNGNNINIADSTDGATNRLTVGSAGDLQIYHNGSNSYIDDTGTGNLFIRSNEVRINKYTNEFMIRAIADGAVELYHDNNKKFMTTSAGIDVTGNISVSGTVDGVDIATRDTLFGGLTSSSGVLTNGVTATTQSAGNNTTRVATTAFVSTAISNLINGAPSALDTLNELAAAMNDDAAFSTTVTNSLATKMPLAGGQFTGNITFSGSQTVDGRDLSVDGAKLDGIASGATNVTNTNQLTNGAGFLTSVGTSNISDNAVTFAKLENIAQNRIIGRTASGTGDPTTLTAANVRSMINVEDGATGDQTSTEIKTLLASDNLTAIHLGPNCITGSQLSNGSVTETIISNNAVTFVKMQDIGHSTIMGRAVGSAGGNPAALTAAQVRAIINVENGATADQSASEILTLIKTVDGGGSGLDADTLDGIGSGSFIRSDADDSFSGTIIANSDAINPVIKVQGGGPNFIRFDSNDVSSDSIDLIYRTTPNTLAFERVSDAQVMFSVDADDAQAIFSGNLDVGSGLDVTGSITATDRLGVGATASNANLVSYVSATGSIPTTGLIQSNNANHALGLWNGNNSASYCGLMLETRTSGAAGWLIANEWQSTFAGDLIFRGRSGGTTSTERLRIKSTGRIEVSDGDIRLQNIVSGITDADSSSIFFRTRQTNGQVATTGGIHAQGQAAWGGDLVLSSKPANSTPNDSLVERVRITAEGSVKFIGNGTPGDNVGSNIIVGRNNTVSEGGEIAMCRASDNNPIWKFDCHGNTAQPKLRMHRSGFSVFEFNFNGNFFRSGTTTSDRDLKENIQNLTGTSLDKVIQLTPKTFNFKESEGFVPVQKTGFIAQEVVSVIPSLVNGTDGNKDMGVDYDGVVAHLVNCVKELKELNDSLKARVEVLEAS